MTQSASFGRAGNLNLTTNTLEVSGGTQVAVDSFAFGQAGNINIIADSINLRDRGIITAATVAGEGGNIQLQILDTLTLEQNSRISALANNNANGGNININAKFIIAFPQQNSDILASAVRGNGGNIDLLSQGIFGISQRSSQPENLTNDIDASSQFGLSGSISIQLPQADAAQGILALSPQLTDVNYLLNNSFCRVSRESNYIVTGRGGIPLGPEDELINSNTWEDWAIGNSSSNSDATQPPTIKPSQPKITPVQGWLVDRSGKIVLTAKPNTVTPQPRQINRPGC